MLESPPSTVRCGDWLSGRIAARFSPSRRSAGADFPVIGKKLTRGRQEAEGCRGVTDAASARG